MTNSIVLSKRTLGLLTIDFTREVSVLIHII